MTNKSTILQLIDRLQEYIKQLQELQKHSLDDFKNDWKIHQLVDHSLHLAVECAIDMGKSLIVGANLRKPRTYKETFDILRGSKIISAELAEELKGLTEFRNRLIHEYLFLDLDEIYNIYHNKLYVFENFIKEVKSYLLNT